MVSRSQEEQGKNLLGKILRLLKRRFGDRRRRDEVEEFNKLHQTSTVKDYQERFEELSSLMLVRDPHLSESYFVSSFISGIKEEIRPMVKMLKPNTLIEAFEIAEWQEQSLALNGRYAKNTRNLEPGENSRYLVPCQQPTQGERFQNHLVKRR